MGGMGASNCGKCSKELPTDGDYVEYDGCKGGFLLCGQAISKSILDQICALPSTKEISHKIQESMPFFNERYEVILSEIKALREENRTLRRELHNLRSRSYEDSETVLALEQEVVETNRYNRRCNMEIQGLQAMENEAVI
ncbi:hypothetical protein J6590_089601 [Homalodisca vitripennis]|nr:hypothetical protein J6590_089601 [Homalodisca vitripennis]